MKNNKFPIEIAPSILAADFARLYDEIALVEAAGCGILHLDIMDGHFVPNISFGPVVCAAVRKVSGAFLDAHLMIDNPENFIEPFREAGVDQLTIHTEIQRDHLEVLRAIRSAGIACGISIKPGTDPAELLEALELVDLVLVMSVEPGFGGQEFIPSTPDRIREIAGMIEDSGRIIEISVDGGINRETAPLVVEAGANRLIAGSAVFRGTPEENINSTMAVLNLEWGPA